MFSCLTARLLYLCQNEALAQTALRQTSYTLTVGSGRGTITDCNGLPLTDTESALMATALPDSDGLPALLSLLEEDERTAAITDAASGTPILAELPADADTSTLPDDIKVFTATRRYGETTLAAHLIGYLDGDGSGAAGLEKSYQEILANSGIQYTVTYATDALGQTVSGGEVAVTETAATAGLQLTIDSRIQAIVEEEGSTIEKGAVVVLEVDTGKIRGCASFPDFSPNAVAEVLESTDAPLFNRAFAAYSVGSVFKTVTTAAAYLSGLSGFTADCTGEITVAGRVFHCHNEEGDGALSIKTALTKSCNPFFIQLGAEIGETLLLQTASDLSFGKAFTVALGMDTAAGSLPQSPLLEAELANLSFGQGELSATPVQIALMMAAVANGGKTPCPSLVEGITDGSGNITEEWESTPPVYALTEEVAAAVAEDLISAVAENPESLAASEIVTIAGKTGTAQTGQYDETGEEYCNGWFAGFFPAESPKYAAVVLCEECISGNLDAAPVFRRIAERIADEV